MTRRKTHDEYVKEVSSINQNIEVVGEYVNAKTKILHMCKIDGYEWYALPNSIIHGHGCPKCSGKFKKTQDEYVQSVFEINQNIDVIGKYVNNKTSILHKCKVDGYEWYAKPYNILNGRGCPKCNKSRGEKDIALWLSNHAVRYEQQKAFDDCKDIKPLPFDFYLPDYNYCIEYDGEQHYRPIDYFGGEDSFKKTVMHDNIKNDYCKNNDIKLLRIPYYANVKKELLSLYNSIIAGSITKEVAA